MQNFNLELFSRLFFLNLSNTIKIDENFSIIAGQPSPSASTQSTLEPPTPPRTPITSLRNNAEKNYNNNNEDGKENFDERGSSSSRNTPVKLSARKNENESDYEDYKRSHFNDDSNNFSDDERGGRRSIASTPMHLNGMVDESDHEESDYASSFDSSKLSLKNVDNFLDKSSPVVSFLAIAI